MNEIGPQDLRPVGGSWSGLLFENELVGYERALTWTFTVDFAEITVLGERVPVSLTIDWVPISTTGWRAMAGHEARSSTFGDPIETSVYQGIHHRYDSAELVVTEQDGEEILIRASVAGDIDNLGLARFTTEATLGFQGIYVQLDDVGTELEAAQVCLNEFTDPTGLVSRRRDHNVVFEPE